jgi:3-polyprenyl-4-hydroxybenzoate decarboxylase
MENPHAERQAVLLERILKNSVRVICNLLSTIRTYAPILDKLKCTGMIQELNHCFEVNISQFIVPVKQHDP